MNKIKKFDYWLAHISSFTASFLLSFGFFAILRNEFMVSKLSSFVLSMIVFIILDLLGRIAFYIEYVFGEETKK